MSSSFLKPSVTPATALAARLRARPWYFASSGLSDSREACSTLSATANLMPGGLARHHAARRRQDAGAEAREHFRDVVPAEVDAAAGTADALHAGDELFAVRAVLEE